MEWPDEGMKWNDLTIYPYRLLLKLIFAYLRTSDFNGKTLKTLMDNLRKQWFTISYGSSIYCY